MLQRLDFKYNGFGTRIEENVKIGASTTAIRHLAYDGLNAWAELDGNNWVVCRVGREGNAGAANHD